MMQTLPLGDLRREPVRSLWYNHIQPPLFDAVRAAIARLYPPDDPETLMRRVDLGLQRVGVLVYALAATLVFRWLWALRGGRTAAIGALFFMFLPGPLFYAYYLDSTLISAALILWFMSELWRYYTVGSAGVSLAAAGILLVATRSVFQWPFVLVLALSAIALAASRESGSAPQARRFLAPIALFVALYLTKQYLLFGLTMTSSFGPDSFCKGLSEYCHGTARVDLPRFTDPMNAIVLRRAEKLNGEYNYNQIAFLKRSFSQMAEYRALINRMTPARVAQVFVVNLEFWLRPTSRHSSHLLVDRLFWRRTVDDLTSGPGLVVLLAASVLTWALGTWRERPSRRAVFLGLGLGAPVLYIAAVTIVFESGENMRYRFFLEPTLFVFVVAQFASITRRLPFFSLPVLSGDGARNGAG
jgi:hypothetical protein